MEKKYQDNNLNNLDSMSDDAITSKILYESGTRLFSQSFKLGILDNEIKEKKDLNRIKIANGVIRRDIKEYTETITKNLHLLKHIHPIVDLYGFECFQYKNQIYVILHFYKLLRCVKLSEIQNALSFHARELENKIVFDNVMPPSFGFCNSPLITVIDVEVGSNFMGVCRDLKEGDVFYGVCSDGCYMAARRGSKTLKSLSYQVKSSKYIFAKGISELDRTWLSDLGIDMDKVYDLHEIQSPLKFSLSIEKICDIYFKYLKPLISKIMKKPVDLVFKNYFDCVLSYRMLLNSLAKDNFLNIQCPIYSVKNVHWVDEYFNSDRYKDLKHLFKFDASFD